MNKPQLLLQRLDQIGESISKKPSALALIGLGSVGIELERLDQFSDLDFFVIVKQGSKVDYLENLSWLTDIAPVAYYFANTKDGFKLLYEDGVFCEFALFDDAELQGAVFSSGRIIWKAEGVADAIGIPQRTSRQAQSRSIEWLIGEALTNIYIGLLRNARGEKLSAMRFIQGHAVDRILELAEAVETACPREDVGAVSISTDPFSQDRRFEQRFPNMALHLPKLLQGYSKNRESALAALLFLDAHFEINLGMKQVILELCSVKDAFTNNV